MAKAHREDAGGSALTIGLVAELTGLSEHTLRVWERRYGVPSPSRTEMGARLYSSADLSRLSVVARATRLGFRPRDVIHRATAEVLALIGAAAPSRGPAASPAASEVGGVLEAVLDDRAGDVRMILRRAAVTLGARAFVTDLVQPLLTRIGLLWKSGKMDIRHEHLVSECVSTQLRVLLAAYGDEAEGPTAVLCTLPGEQHVLGLPMVALYLATLGVRPLLLGPNTPAADLGAAAAALNATIVGISVTCPPDVAPVESAVRAVRAALPRGVAVWVGGPAAAALTLPRGVTRVLSWVDMDRGVERPRAIAGRRRAVDA